MERINIRIIIWNDRSDDNATSLTSLSLRLLKSGLLDVRLFVNFNFKKDLNLNLYSYHILMDLTQTSSSDIDQALLSSSTSEERKKLAKSFGGDWSEGEEESSSSRNQAFLKELYENKQINETSKCVLIKTHKKKITPV